MADFYFEGSAAAGRRQLPAGVRPQHGARLRPDPVHEGDLSAERLARRPDRDPVRRLRQDLGAERLHRRELLPVADPRAARSSSSRTHVFAFCPWVILTMEHLADYFEPVAFAEYSSVVYLCAQPIPPVCPRSRAGPRAPDGAVRPGDRPLPRLSARRPAVRQGRASRPSTAIASRRQAIVERLSATSGEHIAVAPAIDLVRGLI